MAYLQAKLGNKIQTKGKNYMALDPDYFARLYIREKIKDISGYQGIKPETTAACNPS